MDAESQLKLQAYLDGELSANESAQVADWAARDDEARLLMAEFKHTKAALSGHETGVKLPEPREFYWSRIEREIQRQTAPGPEISPGLAGWLFWLQRHLVSTGAGAALACLLMVLLVHSGRSGSQLGEIELASDEMGAYTFRNQSEKLTMVWLYDRSDDSQFTQDPVTAKVDLE
jgi:anti-sigma factor RsiW